MKIVVAGWVAPLPLAGYFWHAVSFALGFRALGHDVWFLEDSGDHPWGWDPDREADDPDCDSGARFLAREMHEVGLGDRWVFRHIPSGRHFGLDAETTADVLAEADLFVNVSCVTTIRPEYRRIPQRIAIDTDPVFTQIRIAAGDPLLANVPADHTRLFTFGRPPLPAQLHDWVPTRQPVAVEHWPVAPPADADAPFTSVTTWRAYPPVEWGGVWYGGKDLVFPEYLDLPRHTGAPFSIAIGAGEEHQMGAGILRAHGWEVTDPAVATRSTEAYRGYIRDSLAEFSVAKHGYVAGRSGWFSDRTCCYLASGRPAVLQETGFSDWLPTGCGIVSFANPSQAVGAIETVLSDPSAHAAAARRIAENHFRADRVCLDLLGAI